MFEHCDLNIEPNFFDSKFKSQCSNQIFRYGFLQKYLNTIPNNKVVIESCKIFVYVEKYQ